MRSTKPLAYPVSGRLKQPPTVGALGQGTNSPASRGPSPQPPADPGHQQERGIMLGSVSCRWDSLPGATHGSSVDIPYSDHEKALESPLWTVGGGQLHREVLSAGHFNISVIMAYIHFQKKKKRLLQFLSIWIREIKLLWSLYIYRRNKKNGYVRKFSECSNYLG